MAEAEVSSLVALVSLYPSTVAAEFTLGSLTVCDPRLPVDHPYRWAVSRAANAANQSVEDGVSYVETVLVDRWWRFLTRLSTSGRRRTGRASSVSARLRPTRVVFLNRFVTECRAFATGLVDGIGEADEGGKESAEARLEKKPPTGRSAVRTPAARGEINAIRLDVALEAPTIVVPRSTGDTSLALELDMGSLAVKNTLEKVVRRPPRGWLTGWPSDSPASASTWSGTATTTEEQRDEEGRDEALRALQIARRS